MNKIKMLEDKIKWVLEKYPETRNDDVLLTFKIIESYAPHLVQHFENKPWISYEGIKWCREDQVKRIRAKLNSKGLYMPTDEKVIKQRRLNQQTWRDFNNLSTT